MKYIFKVVFREERCKGCTLCVKFCPKKIISISDNLNNFGYYVAHIKEELRSNCIGCGFCFRMCPDSVITIFDKVEKAGEIK